jgi:hypothetical protein
VITQSGGTLGLTSAYGVNDPTITRKRVEADLAVFCDYKHKYIGMLEVCKEQLNWSLERYAKFPNPPELLPVKTVRFISDHRIQEIKDIFSDFGGVIIVLLLLACAWAVYIPAVLGYIIFYLIRLLIARIENGRRPLENARRRKAYDEARLAALKAAEPIKAAQDHRLRSQICELDGLIMTVSEKAEDLRRILTTL